MTTFEHAMLGINGVLASGIHRRFGWQIVALAGIAAVAPDWDGIPMLVNLVIASGGTMFLLVPYWELFLARWIIDSIGRAELPAL
jgi:hypothetical protein